MVVVFPVAADMEAAEAEGKPAPPPPLPLPLPLPPPPRALSAHLGCSYPVWYWKEVREEEGAGMLR